MGSLHLTIFVYGRSHSLAHHRGARFYSPLPLCPEPGSVAPQWGGPGPPSGASKVLPAAGVWVPGSCGCGCGCSGAPPCSGRGAGSCTAAASLPAAWPLPGALPGSASRHQLFQSLCIYQGELTPYITQQEAYARMTICCLQSILSCSNSCLSRLGQYCRCMLCNH